MSHTIKSSIKQSILLIGLQFIFLMPVLAQKQDIPFECRTDSMLIPSGSDELYFPSGTFSVLFEDASTSYDTDQALNRWYSKNLFAFREPILFSDHSDKEIYRLMLMDVYGSRIVIRLLKCGDSYILFWEKRQVVHEELPGPLIESDYKIVDRIVWDKFCELLVENKFWRLHTNEMEGGRDGKQWVMEGKSGKRYHVVDRWAPKRSTRFYNCCAYLINLTGMRNYNGKPY